MSPRCAVTVVVIALGSACSSRTATLTQLVEARQLASTLQVDFMKATGASNQAVMADTDEASSAAAGEARQAREMVHTHIEALRVRLQSLGYRDDLRALDAFEARFEAYRQLDDEILPLAVENTNLKAQRLSFGPAQEAAEAFGAAVDAAARASRGSCCSQATVHRARAAVLEIQVLQAPHIAEADDAVMARIEGRMKALAATSRAAIADLAAPAATSALDRFLAVNDEIVTLSRRNSNVRSLALSLGRKRTVTAECEDDLRALEEALARHEFTATR